MSQKIEPIASYSEDKNNHVAKYVGAGVGSAVGLSGSVDLRKKIDVSKAKNLGSTWDRVQKHIKPGDVIIGSNATATEVIKNEYQDFRKGLSKKNLGKKISKIDVASLASKLGDPVHSHAAVFANKGQLAYGGGLIQHVTSEIPKSKAALNKMMKEKGYQKHTPHFIVLRPKANTGLVSQIIKEKGGRFATKTLKRSAGAGGDYSFPQILKATVKDMFIPKLQRQEKIKDMKSMACDSKIVGGMCSTTGAQYSKYTVGGKSTKNVLPQDYLHSSNYDLVGRIGPKAKFKASHIPFRAVKLGIRGAAGLAAGAGTYAAIMHFQNKKNDTGNIS